MNNYNLHSNNVLTHSLTRIFFNVGMSLGDSGCRVVAEELTNNTTLTKLNLEGWLLIKKMAHISFHHISFFMFIYSQKTESVILV